MDKRLKFPLMVAVLLAGGGALWHDGALVRPGAEPARSLGGFLDVAQVAPQPSRLEQCLQATRIIADVHWAAACMAQLDRGAPGADGHAECDLPDDQAAAVNAWQDDAEAKCLAETRGRVIP